ncbi:hypothetical protein [Nocardioides sp. GXQ0305]|uniref:hypothetical protein n=1 Tax=Nocardioides sp. GXQ0305 TaxID=3423912 RepID=UPI003D7EFF89
MSVLEVGLVVAVALLAVVVAAQGRALSAAARRLELLERRVDRRDRLTGEPATAPPTQAPESAPTPTTPADLEGDAVDVRGTDPEGEPTVIPLEATAQPTLLAFLSTSCDICVGLWERLRDGALASGAPGVVPVVVTRDATQEDAGLVRSLATAEVPVVLSSEAWDDYEVPGSPYVMVVSAAPGSVAAEGSVATWEDLVRIARSAT